MGGRWRAAGILFRHHARLGGSGAIATRAAQKWTVCPGAPNGVQHPAGAESFDGARELVSMRESFARYAARGGEASLASFLGTRSGE